MSYVLEHYFASYLFHICNQYTNQDKLKWYIQYATERGHW